MTRYALFSPQAIPRCPIATAAEPQRGSGGRTQPAPSQAEGRAAACRERTDPTSKSPGKRLSERLSERLDRIATESEIKAALDRFSKGVCRDLREGFRRDLVWWGIVILLGHLISTAVLLKIFDPF